MNARFLCPLLATLLLTAGSAQAKAKTPKYRLKTATLAKKGKRAQSFFLASTPHVPLAIVDGADFKELGGKKTCGSADRWSKVGSQWRSLDAWGQVSGKFEIASGELYDVTQCHEVSLKGRSGTAGVGLFVSTDSAWKAPKSASWTPSEAEKTRFVQFLKTTEATWVNGKLTGKLGQPLDRVRFFDLNLGKDQQAPKHWAVSGGPILVVAYLGEHGAWKSSLIKLPLGQLDGRSYANAYRAVAVFDMNGDGTTEIVFHSDEGPSFADEVLTFGGANEWKTAAQSPGGATL